MAAPPEPAGAVSVTVPVPDWLLAMVLGETETPLSATEGGFTVRAKVLLTPELEAVNVTEVAVFTLPVVTEKVAEVDP